MHGPSLEAALKEHASPVAMLRNLPTAAHTFPVVPEFTNWRSEQRAWRETCALLDQSHHMTDLLLSGPDALRLLADFGVNGFDGFVPGRAKQYVACDDTGHVIGDAILFHLDEGSFDLVGHPTVPNWLQYNAEAGDYDVTIERDENSAVRPSGPPRFYRYELQGPTALTIIEQAVGAELPDVKFFDVTTLEIAGRQVRALRHGMAGQPGFELFGPWEDNEPVLDTLLQHGREHGLVRAGAKAYSSANLESGWVPTPVPAIFGDAMADYRAWLPAASVGSLGGSLDTPDIADYHVTPYELGYGKVVRFDHDFVGRSALEAMDPDQQRRKVTLVFDPDDVAALFRSLLEPGLPAKYLELPKARLGMYHADEVRVDGHRVGISMDVGYLTNEQAFVSLASVTPSAAEVGTTVEVLWGEQPNSAKPTIEPHRQVAVRATVAPAPFAQTARETYRR